MESASTEFTVLENGMILHIRKPQLVLSDGMSLLLHGWTGDENSMNSFWRYVPKHHWIIAPRSPLAASPNGYGWADIKGNSFPNFAQFLSSVETLISNLQHFRKSHHLENTKMNIFGFSQGAAVAYMLAALIPQEIEHILPIAGFMPEGTLSEIKRHQHRNNKIHIFHGAKDNLVPYNMAKQTHTDLVSLGYQTNLCIDEHAGHKFGAACLDYLKSIPL